jgi:host factor-I protein
MTFASNFNAHRPDRDHHSREIKLQDVFLNFCRKEKTPVTIQLLDHSIKNGHIIGFDSQTIILDEEGHQHLIYKSAIVAINPQVQVNYIFNENYKNDILNERDRGDLSKGYPEYAADFS